MSSHGLKEEKKQKNYLKGTSVRRVHGQRSKRHHETLDVNLRHGLRWL